MNRTCASSAAALLLLTVAGGAGAQAPVDDPEVIVAINGTAYRAVVPTGPDFQGIGLIPFQARNPTRATWTATLAQNARYLAQGATPQNIQVSREGQVEGASQLVTDFSEVMVALDPTDPEHLLAASKFFNRPENYGFYSGVFESDDGGRTWHQRQPDGVERYGLTSDPVTAFDDEGSGLFNFMTRGPTGIDVQKKVKGGDWEQPVTVDRTTITDKQWIASDQDPDGVSRYAGHLYVSWSAIGGGANGTAITFARSINRNATWSRPLELAADSPTGDVQGSIPAVAPDGAVYVLYGRRIFGGPVKGRLEITKSTNGGVSFIRPTLAANITAIPFFLPNGSPGVNFRTPASLPAFAISPADGNLYAAWADYRHNDADVYLARSIDGGRTWDEPVRLNDDPVGNGVDQIQPQVAVALNGRVAVSWFDRRLPCPDLPWIDDTHVGQANTCIDTFMTRSFDGGATWEPNIRASAQTWDWRLSLPIADSRSSPRTGFIGDYVGLAASDDYDYPVWSATANLGDNPDNRQQIFVARVPAGWVPPTVTPTVTASPTAAPTGTAEPSPTASGTPTAGATASATPTPSATPTAPSPTTAAPTGTPSATAEPKPPHTGSIRYLPLVLSGMGVE